MKSYRSRRRPQLAFFRFFDHADRLRRAFFRTNPTAFAVLEVNLDRDGALHHRVRTVKPADVTRGSFIPAGCAFVMINHGPEGPPVSRPAPLSRAQAGMSVGEWVQFSCLSHDVLPRSLFSTPKGAASKSYELRVASYQWQLPVNRGPFHGSSGVPAGHEQLPGNTVLSRPQQKYVTAFGSSYRRCLSRQVLSRGPASRPFSGFRLKACRNDVLWWWLPYSCALC